MTATLAAVITVPGLALLAPQADDIFTAQPPFPLYNRKIVFLADAIVSGARLWRTSRPMLERVYRGEGPLKHED